LLTFDEALSALIPDIIDLRRELHKIPERGWTEAKTQAALLSFLERHGCRPVTIGGTGLLVDLPVPATQSATAGAPPCPPTTPSRPRRIAVRADLDALPVKESTGLAFASEHDGLMHACGHDMHAAAVAGLAAVLARLAQDTPDSAADVASGASDLAARQARDASVSLARLTHDASEPSTRIASNASDPAAGLTGTTPDVPPSSAVRLIFQPAEEGSATKVDFDDLLKPRTPRRRGALVMIDEGALRDVDAIVGLHCWPDLPVGTIGVDPKIAMAGNAALHMRIHGKGGHGATPHRTIDPVPVAATLILALQTIASRRSNPAHPFVLSVCSMHAGTTGNVIPDRADLIATLRSSTPGFLDKEMPAMLNDMIHGICNAYGAEAEMAYNPGLPPVVNDASLVRQFLESGNRALGDGKVIMLDEAAMTSEDHAYYAAAIPSVYVKLGVAGAAGCAPLHSPLFSPDEGALETAIRAIGAFVQDFLAR
jgi:amidohydrolase